MAAPHPFFRHTAISVDLQCGQNFLSSSSSSNRGREKWITISFLLNNPSVPPGQSGFGQYVSAEGRGAANKCSLVVPSTRDSRDTPRASAILRRFVMSGSFIFPESLVEGT